MPGLADLNRVIATLQGVTPDYLDEYTLQAQLAEALGFAGFTVAREWHLRDGAGRIDLLATTADTVIGIEVKIAGRMSDVLEQLSRYAGTGQLHALVLVTTRAKHHHIPTELNGIPLRLVTYVAAGL